jgi:hypothetical protein
LASSSDIVKIMKLKKLGRHEDFMWRSWRKPQY